jgi:DNA-binding IclR family transcriptional regulator
MKHRAIVEAVLLFTVIYQERPTSGSISRLLDLPLSDVWDALDLAEKQGWLERERPTLKYILTPKALSELLSQPGLPWVLNIHRRLAAMHRGPVAVDRPGPGTEGLSL